MPRSMPLRDDLRYKQPYSARKEIFKLENWKTLGKVALQVLKGGSPVKPPKNTIKKAR